MAEEPSGGHWVWHEWIFDYQVLGTEGLSLLNGYFKGRRAFAKMSLPVIRVKYTSDESWPFDPFLDTGCGPYNDQITWDPVDFGEDLNFFSGPHHLVEISNCNDRYICIKEIDFNGERALEVGVYARIGAYHIYQAWYLLRSGALYPRVWSKGLSCNLDHWHHPYWRFDFNLDGPGNHRVNCFQGVNFAGFVTLEGKFYAHQFSHYLVENLSTTSQVTIQPPPLDDDAGIVGPDWFSDLDVYVRKFRPEEDRSWPHAPDHDIGFPVHENPDGQNVVFWSVCHLFHRADEGEDHWHSVGPSLHFHTPRELHPPRAYRKIRLWGIMHLKDFRAVGKDKWSHPTFDEVVTIDPGGSHGEFLISKYVGDIRADLHVVMDLQADLSVETTVVGRLVDEDEEVAVKTMTRNLLMDGGLKGYAHLTDSHWGDPDKVNIDFEMTNFQV